MSRWIPVFLLAGVSVAGDDVASSLSTLTSPGMALDRRLDAVDRLAELKAARELIQAWAAGGEAVRLAVPVGFHALGVRGLGNGLTAMGDAEPNVRAAGAVLLGSIGREGRLGVRKLTIALGDESALVRRHAAEALGNIGAAAEEALSGLIALAMEEKELAAVAMRAMTRITLDVQLHLHRRKLPDQVRQTVEKAESWLLQQQKPDGSWGSVDDTAFVVLALAEGGLRDPFRLPVRRAMRRLVLDLASRPRAEPLALLATHATMRSTRDPLLRILAERQGARVRDAKETDDAVRLAWRLLALRSAQWSGDAVDAAEFATAKPTDPDLVGLVLAPNPDAKAIAASAERMMADKIVWRKGEKRWGPGPIARSSWAIELAGGRSAEDYRKLAYAAAMQSRLVVNDQLLMWETPPGVQESPVRMTAAVVIALKIVSGAYPPRALPKPMAAKQKIAIAALKGCLRHPDEKVQAYARSMLTLWE